MLLARALGKIFSIGTLTVTDAHGRVHRFHGRAGPRVAVRLHDPALHWKLLSNPWLHVGESYMEGTLTIEEGSLKDFLELCCANVQAASGNAVLRLNDWLGYKMRWFNQHNPVGRAKHNVAHHYDLSGLLYELFLDKDRQYSCAYFADSDDTLEAAQENKKRHIAAKLLLSPGQKVLDIGSGWGGLALYIAQQGGCDVTGVTLSEEQHRESEKRAQAAGLGNRVRFFLRDYREDRGTYDRIVSVGMFEHVGAKHYGEFFGKLRDLMTDNGVALLHSIGRMEGPGSTNPWLRKYIFPGGYTPALSETLTAVERAGLYVTDVEILRLHYAETLKHWAERFQANRTLVAQVYDERFCRMWEFYLQGCEMSFRYWNQMVFQMQITKRQDAVPLTRDYMLDWERAHAPNAQRRQAAA